ncbi:MAG: type II toxin-antitoxin system HicB family antitoxin [Spirochaetales bacterium]
MKLSYPALFSPQPDGSWLVEFPDLPGCLTEGPNKTEAAAAASEALSAWLESVLAREVPFCEPSNRPDLVNVEPEANVAFAFWLRRERQRSGLTLTDVATRLGVKYQVYQKLENPATANPTLKTLKKLEAVFGQTLVLV